MSRSHAVPSTAAVLIFLPQCLYLICPVACAPGSDSPPTRGGATYRIHDSVLSAPSRSRFGLRRPRGAALHVGPHSGPYFFTSNSASMTLSSLGGALSASAEGFADEPALAAVCCLATCS